MIRGLVIRKKSSSPGAWLNGINKSKLNSSTKIVNKILTFYFATIDNRYYLCGTKAKEIVNQILKQITMLTVTQQKQHADFKVAKSIALAIGKNQMRRAAGTNYFGANFNGRMFVIGDTVSDIQNPDTYIQGMPAREIFGEFTVMSK